MTKDEIKALIIEKGTKKLVKEKIVKSQTLRKTCDYIDFKFSGNSERNNAIKAEGKNLEDTGILEVDVVANMAMFQDSDEDVLAKNSWFKTVEQRGQGNMIPILKDHIHTTGGIIGETISFYDKQVDLMPYGYTGFGDALAHKFNVIKDIDEATYNRYLRHLIKQHSIGLQYVNIMLAVNDPEFEDEFKVWNAYIEQIINKEHTKEVGYFWYVTEIKLVENSAVLFGANPLTPTLSTQPQSTEKHHKNQNKSDFYKRLTTR